MLDAIVSNYLSTAKGLPFFYAVSDANYASVLAELKQTGLRVIHISDFCKKPDKFPDLDDLLDSFRIADVDYNSNKCVLIGLGEYLALRGEKEALKAIRYLKGATLGIARVVILLRYVTPQLKAIVDEDLKMTSQQRVFFDDDFGSNTSVVNIKTESNLGLVKDKGIKFLLQQFEDGAKGKVYVKSNLYLNDSLLPMVSIESSYSAIKQLERTFSFSESLGKEEMWKRLLSDMQRYGKCLASVLKHYNLIDDLEDDFKERAFGLEYKNWLYFIALKLDCEHIKNPYLKYIIEKTDDFALLKETTINAIIDIPHTAKNFSDLYLARKKLLRGITDVDIASFIHENEIEPAESIYKLTDNTLKERQAIIRWVSTYGIIPEIKEIYPALTSYLKTYTFDCGSISHDLTVYFDIYKQQKIQNKVFEDFATSVNEYAIRYTKLDTRANIISSISDKKSCYLYWIDALGVEYLSYIQDLAKEKGLAIKIDIARADLPTITSINKSFYENWNGGNKQKESRLDDIKHKEKGGFDYTICEAPIHLANELDVIKEAINIAYSMLAQHSCKKFIIASDHGASRLAVISKIEEKYETDTKGEHSGRCCKYFDGCDIKNHMSENGFIVLTDYGRFKGSRGANVEVHGGASLEETVIPIITLTLKNNAETIIKVLNADSIVVEKKKGITFVLYISDVEDSEKISVVMNGKKYMTECIDKTHYKVVNTDIKRSGHYIVDVFDGENLVGSQNINVKGATGSVKSDFDDLF